jgi:hypothetical protein
MSGVFQNIDPPPSHRPASVYPTAFGAGEDTLAGWRGGGESIFWKTPDTALYSTYVSTLWVQGLDPGQQCGWEQGYAGHHGVAHSGRVLRLQA